MHAFVVMYMAVCVRACVRGGAALVAACLGTYLCACIWRFVCRYMRVHEVVNGQVHVCFCVCAFVPLVFNGNFQKG